MYVFVSERSKGEKRHHIAFLQMPACLAYFLVKHMLVCFLPVDDWEMYA